MKKRLLFCLWIALVFVIVVLFVKDILPMEKKEEKEIIESVNLETIDERIIGSEPPKLLYADSKKVIFDCCGVYVYDIENQKLMKSFDVQGVVSNKHGRWSCFVSEDGKQILFHIENEKESSYLYYCYYFDSDQLKKISKKEYTNYRQNAFECTYLDYNDELYQQSSGTIVKISPNEYVYLTFEDWLLSTIKIVDVMDGRKTYYKVFDVSEH